MIKEVCSLPLIAAGGIGSGQAIAAIMALGAENGETVSLTIEGEDEEEAFQLIKDFFEKK